MFQVDDVLNRIFKGSLGSAYISRQESRQSKTWSWNVSAMTRQGKFCSRSHLFHVPNDDDRWSKQLGSFEDLPAEKWN